MVELSALLHVPPHDEEGFLEFERIARLEMDQQIARLGQNDSWEDTRLEYMSAVQAAFEEFEIGGVGDLGEYDRTYGVGDFAWFNQAVKKIVTRLQVRAVRRTRVELIELEVADQSKLKAEITRLKNRVESASDLTDDRKKAIRKKLDELLEEITKPRLNWTKFVVALAAVAAAVNGIESAAIRAPETLVALLDTVHIVAGKEAERRAVIEHYRKPRAIEHQPEDKARPTAPKAAASFSDDLDDEIPF